MEIDRAALRAVQPLKSRKNLWLASEDRQMVAAAAGWVLQPARLGGAGAVSYGALSAGLAVSGCASVAGPAPSCSLCPPGPHLPPPRLPAAGGRTRAATGS